MDRQSLEAARSINSRVRRCRLEIEELRASLLPSAIRYDRERVKTTPEDVISKVEARIDELERMIIGLEQRKAEAICEIGRAIDSVSDALTAEIMTEYFINGKRARDIAKEQGYTKRWINQRIQTEIERGERHGANMDT